MRLPNRRRSGSTTAAVAIALPAIVTAASPDAKALMICSVPANGLPETACRAGPDVMGGAGYRR